MAELLVIVLVLAFLPSAIEFLCELTEAVAGWAFLALGAYVAWCCVQNVWAWVAS